jgi:hypothetical protein
MEQQQSRSAPPPAYSIPTPSGMENEIYIDGTLHIDGKPVEQGGQGKYCVRERQRNKNACGQLFRLIRSNYFF